MTPAEELLHALRRLPNGLRDDEVLATIERAFEALITERDALRQSCADLGAAIGLERDRADKAEVRVAELKGALSTAIARIRARHSVTDDLVDLLNKERP